MKATTVAVAGDSTAHALNLRGTEAIITNRGAQSVWLGGENVDNGAHGYELKAGETQRIDCSAEDLYAWASALGSLGIIAVRKRSQA